jgi:hypothetical protein
LELLCHVGEKIAVTAVWGREEKKPHWRDADPCQITFVPVPVRSIPKFLRRLLGMLIKVC